MRAIQAGPGLGMPAGPLGPSQVVATARPVPRTCRQALAPETAPAELEPLTKDNRRPDRSWTKASPSLLDETSADTGRARKKAEAATRSRCQHAKTVGPSRSSSDRPNRRLSSQNRPIGNRSLVLSTLEKR